MQNMNKYIKTCLKPNNTAASAGSFKYFTCSCYFVPSRKNSWNWIVSKWVSVKCDKTCDFRIWTLSARLSFIKCIGTPMNSVNIVALKGKCFQLFIFIKSANECNECFRQQNWIERLEFINSIIRMDVHVQYIDSLIYHSPCTQTLNIPSRYADTTITWNGIKLLWNEFCGTEVKKKKVNEQMNKHNIWATCIRVQCTWSELITPMISHSNIK